VTAEIQDEIDDRQDLRDLTTWTTDPIDAQDFDDAISIEERDDEYVLWVHIADVTHYVNPETAMWDEAVERGNTVLSPVIRFTCCRVLAETVCSLVPNEDRLAHTVEMHLDKENLTYENIEIYKSVIESDERLTPRGGRESPRGVRRATPRGERAGLRSRRADARTAQGRRLARLESEPRPRPHHHRGVHVEGQQGRYARTHVESRRLCNVPGPPQPSPDEGPRPSGRFRT